MILWNLKKTQHILGPGSERHVTLARGKGILIKGVGFSSQFADYSLFIRRRIILIELTKNGMVCYAKINVKMVEKMFMLYIPATLAPKVCMHGYWTLTFFLGGMGG